ncbi:hypothetical protein [Microbacterium sp.]|uniref:hypothetical protein n=1 Tax=Microbacterium sp. TaxID=51671 RepID=UPI002D775425|nr:hypothetical protein [Microbacterium sp.]HET6302681.1 hypothetical protein [Microbacterium sp.]
MTNRGETVDITGTTNRGGSSAHDPAEAPVDQSAPPTAPDDCATATVCREMPYEIVSVPDVTIEDLVSFRPAAPTLTGEPLGFGVVGLPANVMAAASEQRLSGELLGWDVTVRFRPAGYVFDYGDGTTVRTATGGAAWAATGQPQFTPTATSHTYRARGTYAVSARVLYSAAVDFGSGVWRPVSGYVTADSGAYLIEVLEARTALVDRTCAEDPRGPGC